MVDIRSLDDLANALQVAIDALEGAQEELVKAAHTAAEAEKDYRLDRSLKFASARVEIGGRDSVGAREYEVDAKAADTRYAAHLAESLRVAALEHVRSRRAILTAVQTVTNAWREEVAFTRGPGGGGSL